MADNFSDILFLCKKGVRLSVKAKPRTSRVRAPKIVALTGGKRAVEITVAAIAEGGKANKAIMDYLAKELGIRKADLALKSGDTGRLKIIEIIGNPSDLLSRVEAWLSWL